MDDGVGEVGSTASFNGGWEDSLFLRDDLATMIYTINWVISNEKPVF